MTVGYNGFGQLGDGSLNSRATAALVPNLGHMDGLAIGAEHTLVFKNNSSVMAWGFNKHGQLGNANVPTGATNSTSDYSATPVRVGSLTHVVSVAAGSYHSLAVSDGRVWSWGNNDFGQLGRGVAGIDGATPDEVFSDLSGFRFFDATQVAAGQNHSLALTVDATGTTKVWAWGDNTYGQLGPNGAVITPTSSVTANVTPIVVPIPGTAKVVQIAANGNFSLALMDDGTVWAWGYNGFGQLGFASNGLIPNPTPHQVKVVDAAGTTLFIHQISAGLGHVLARVSSAARASDLPGADRFNDTVWGWGFNERGQLGNNPRIGDASNPPNAFVPVQALIGGSSAIGSGSPITGVQEILAFGNSSIVTLQHAATEKPQAWGFGENSFGQLGAPTVTTGIGYLVIPVPVAGF